MRTVKEPDVRRQEILDGAIRVFARKGYDKATIADIARELNISQGLCYRYYPSKEEIYDAALDKYAELLAQGNMRKMTIDMPLRELIDRLMDRADSLKDTEHADQELYEMFHSKDNRRLHDDLFIRTAKKVIPYVQEHLRRAKERGETSIPDTDSAAIVGIFGWVGIFMAEGMSDEERMQSLRLMWYRLLEL